MRWLRAGGKRDWDGTGGQHRLEMHGISAVSHSVHTCGPAQAFAIVSARLEWMREPRLLRTSSDTWMICALRCSHAVAGSAFASNCGHMLLAIQ
jgi:hypothetical protein